MSNYCTNTIKKLQNKFIKTNPCLDCMIQNCISKLVVIIKIIKEIKAVPECLVILFLS